MRLLPKIQTENYCTYLSDYLFEELDEIVYKNVNSFISEDRDYRLKLIHSIVNVELIPDFIAADYSPLTQAVVKHKALTTFDKELENVLTEYEKHGAEIFSGIEQIEKFFAKIFMNQFDSFEFGYADLIKGKLKFYHYQEIERRKRLQKRNELAFLLLNKTTVESVLDQFRRFNDYELEIQLVVGKWKSNLFDKMIRRVDRAHQRFIVNKFLSSKEVVDNILKKIEVLDKKMKNLESKLAKKKAKKGSFVYNEILIFLLENKIEIDFYNKFLIESLAAVAKEENAKEGVGTIMQQNLVVFYLLEYGKIMDYNIDDTIYAHLIRFLTGKNYHGVRKVWAKTILKSSGERRIKDLRTVRGFFVAINADEIVKMIDNDINLKSKYS